MEGVNLNLEFIYEDHNKAEVEDDKLPLPTRQSSAFSLHKLHISSHYAFNWLEIEPVDVGDGTRMKH